MLLKSTKETRSTFVARMVRKLSWNSSFVSIIFLFLVLKTSHARILVPEQQGKVSCRLHLLIIHSRPQSNGPSYVNYVRILCVVCKSVEMKVCRDACKFHLRKY
jgi:septum formation topological specificity factor MinE